MKGIIFNLLSESVIQEFGENTWDDLLDAAGLDGAYTSLGNYDDAEIFKLVGVASEKLKLPPDEVLRWFGRTSMPLLQKRYPGFFAPHDNTRSFALTLNDIIHPEVRKLYPGAITPVFDFDNSNPEELVMGYQSARKLCALAEGFLAGAAEHYGERLDFQQPCCMNRGDQKCVFNLKFAKLME